MLIDHWPLVGLRLLTSRLELRLPVPEELAGLADLAAEGVHDPTAMPFSTPWTDQPPADRARSVLQYAWSRLAAWTPDDWELNLAVFEGDRVLGTQSISARRFAVLGQVETGSWLGRRYHGRGVGTEMRTAVLHLAFAGLDADEAISSAFDDNPASTGVSTKLGYRDDGVERVVRRGSPGTMRRFRLPRAAWRDPYPVEIIGLTACLPLFGRPAATG